MTVLELENQEVKIEQGELVSYAVNGHEFMHQKGSPGWGSSDTEMFPIIGPVNEAEFKVKTPKGAATQDQHGHLRLMDYELNESSTVHAIFSKTYKAGSLVKNKKYPKKSDEQFLNWPYSFEFKKQFHLTAKGLEIRFEISGEEHMPFMLGYHPAFKLHTTNPVIKTNQSELRLEEVLAVGSRAFEVTNCNELTLVDEQSLTIRTEGFQHFMCWTEVSNMICLEPITFYPYAVSQKNLHTGFQKLEDVVTFTVFLQPNA